MSISYTAFRDIFGFNYFNTGYGLETNDNLFLYNNCNLLDDVFIQDSIIVNNNYTNKVNFENKELSIINKIYCDFQINNITNTIVKNNLTVTNILYSNDLILNKNINIQNILNIYNNCILNNIVTNQLNVINNITILTNATCKNNLYITNTLSGSYISTNSIVGNTLNMYNSTFNTKFNINNNLSVTNALTCMNILNTSGVQCNTITFLSSLNVNKTTMSNIMICNSDVYIAGDLIVANNGILNVLEINGILNTELLNYPDNDTAKLNGLTVNTLYRTADIIKIVINDEPTIISLIGNNEIILYIADTVNDPGVAIDNAYTLTKNGFVYTHIQNNYNIYYNAVDNNGIIKQSVTRTFKVYNYPNIVNILYDNVTNNINITTIGTYSTLTYRISNNTTIIIQETIGSTIISTQSLATSVPTIKYTIIIYLKRNSGEILNSSELIFYK